MKNFINVSLDVTGLFTKKRQNHGNFFFSLDFGEHLLNNKIRLKLLIPSCITA